MNTRIRSKLVWVILFAFIFQNIVPLFAQTDAAIGVLFDKYKAAYTAYTGAVAQGSNSDVLEQKLNDYRLAYEAYNKAIYPSKGKTVSGGTASSDEPAGTSSNAAATPTTVTAAPAQVASNSAAEIAKTEAKGPMSWFSKTFNDFKTVLLGEKGKQMPLWEKLAWNIGKALVPAFGVMLATALLAPLSPIAMIAGGVITGAALGGLMTYAFEKRMNAKYRETPKEDSKIWRDVTVGATVEAVMAPFNMATGGLFGMVGPTVGSAIYRVAATQAALSFAGAGLSSVAGGVVKHAWSKYYFKYPEKIKENEAKIDKILNDRMDSGTSLSESDVAELDRLRGEIDTMKGEDYSPDDFTKDMKRAAITAAISGFAGSVISDKVYSSQSGRWADRISVKVFGSAAQGKQISGLVSTLPVNFVGGGAQATLEKSFISNDIKTMREEQKGYPSGSPAYQYYENAVKSMEDKREGISIVGAGVDSMLSNFAVRSAQLSVQALKYNLYDGPKARQNAIDERYRQENPEWKKASDLYEDYQGALGKMPDIKKYRNPVTYAKAQANYLKQVENSRRAWLDQCSVAKGIENQPAQQALKTEIATTYDRDVKLNQMLELGRLSGGWEHLKAMKEVLKSQNPELANLPDADLNQLAVQTIKNSYQGKSQEMGTKVAAYDDTMNKYEAYKAGRLKLSDSEAKTLAGQKALISPSQYKAALVEQKVYELKAQGTAWSKINAQMPDLLSSCEQQTMSKYGGNWAGVLTAEMYANGLAKYKYDPNGGANFATEFKKLAGQVPGMVQSGVINDYKAAVNSAIIGGILPQDVGKDDQFSKYMNTFAKTAITESNSNIIDGVYGSSRDAIFSSFKR
ncbi:MAG: hypothetical protein WA705_00330 [Candidatus Ozemobacteraceae bacterium]